MKKQYTLPKCRFNLLLIGFILFSLGASAQTNWYYKGTGELNNVNSWGSNANGTGTSPADFTAATSQYIIANATAVAANGLWTVSGSGSKVILGNPAPAGAAITLTLNAGAQIVVPSQSFDVSLPVSGTQKIIYKNTNILSLGAVNDASLELVFDGAVLSMSSTKIFGNVSLINNAAVDMGSAATIFNNLTVAAGSSLSGPTGASSNYIGIKAGGTVIINGEFKAGRAGSVTAAGGLYTTGATLFPAVVTATTNGTLLFESATANITLGSTSTIDYYRGTSGQTGVQGITPMAYANLKLTNQTTASAKSFNIANATISVSGTLTIDLLSGATITQPPVTTTINLLPGAVLKINSATALPTNGRLFLRSDVNGTASIGTLATGASVTGNVTVEQYIPGGFRKYRFLSHPFTDPQPLSILTDDIDITGNTAGTTGQPGQTVGAGFTSTSTNNPSAYFFNTASADGNATSDAGWSAFTGATATSWAKGQGIRVLIRGTKGQSGTLDGTNAAPVQVTLNMSGTVNTGNVATNLVTGGTGATAGFNLVGNPYPSPVDVGAVLTAATNIGSAFYLRNPQTGSYITVSPIPASYIIPTYTAFVVKANAATTLNFTELNKNVCVSCNIVFRSANNANGIQIKAMQNDMEFDNMIINFGNYKNSYEEKYDAVKMQNEGLNIAVLSSDNRQLAADYRSNSNGIIPLAVNIPKQYGRQVYALQVSNFNVDANTKLVLHDKLKNTYTTLKANSIYQLEVDANVAGATGNNRLEIIVSKN